MKPTFSVCHLFIRWFTNHLSKNIYSKTYWRLRIVSMSQNYNDLIMLRHDISNQLNVLNGAFELHQLLKTDMPLREIENLQIVLDKLIVNFEKNTTTSRSDR